MVHLDGGPARDDDRPGPDGPCTDLDALTAAAPEPRGPGRTRRRTRAPHLGVHAPVDPADPSQGHDLDRTTDHPSLQEWPAGTPPFLRTPLALLLAVVLAVAATGGVLGHQARTAADARVAAERALASVEVTGVALRTAVVLDVVTGRPVPPADGVRRVRLQVVLTSSGPPVLDAVLVDLEVDGLDDDALEPAAAPGAAGPGAAAPGAGGAAGPAPALVLAAGAGAEGVLDLAVSCADVPRPSGRSAWSPARSEQLVVAVAVGREVREERLPLGVAQGGVGERLARMCHPWQEVSVGVSSARVTADGDLEVMLRDAGAVPAQVVLGGRPSRQVVADPALPLVLARGGSTRLLLRAEPDCAAAADPLRDVLQLRAVPADGYPGAQGVTLDSAPTEAWWARAAALACG